MKIAMKTIFKKMMLFCTGYTYSNLSRLFLRLFVGVMFLHVCVRQFMDLGHLPEGFDGFWGMAPDTSMTLLLIVGSLCAAFIILGFLTRIAVIPPLVVMCVAEVAAYSSYETVAPSLFTFQPGYPVMFIGIFLFFLLSGPGKISLDYVISAQLVEPNDDDEILQEA